MRSPQAHAAPVEGKARGAWSSKTPSSSGDTPLGLQPALTCVPGSSRSSTAPREPQNANPKGSLVTLQPDSIRQASRPRRPAQPRAWGGCVVATLPGAMATARKRPLCLRGRQEVCLRHGCRGPATFGSSPASGARSASVSSGRSQGPQLTTQSREGATAGFGPSEYTMRFCSPVRRRVYVERPSWAFFRRLRETATLNRTPFGK